MLLLERYTRQNTEVEAEIGSVGLYSISNK